MRIGMKKTSKNTEMPAYIPADADFCLKNNAGEIAIDNNFAAQSFWKEVILRYLRKISAVAGLILIVLITIMAVVGPGMSGYSYSEQNLLQKNLAPRIPGFDRPEFLMAVKKCILRPEQRRSITMLKISWIMFITGSGVTISDVISGPEPGAEPEFR